MAATIQFKTKVRNVYNADETLSHRIVMVPVFTRAHCDMDAFRRHPKYGGIANSTLFPNALTKIRRDVTRDYIRLDRIPECVTVDESGFLAVVTVTV